jgi:Tfp pilus assembly protein FimT
MRPSTLVELLVAIAIIAIRLELQVVGRTTPMR